LVCLKRSATCLPLKSSSESLSDCGSLNKRLMAPVAVVLQSTPSSSMVLPYQKQWLSRTKKSTVRVLLLAFGGDQDTSSLPALTSPW